jgi:hypothetical protein
MTPIERDLLVFIELNQPVAKGTFRDCIGQDIEIPLCRLIADGLLVGRTRPTAQGEMTFYSINDANP